MVYILIVDSRGKYRVYVKKLTKSLNDHINN